MDKLLFDLKYSQELLIKLKDKGFTLKKCIPSINFLEFAFIGLYNEEELKILKMKVRENL